MIINDFISVKIYFKFKKLPIEIHFEGSIQ